MLPHNLACLCACLALLVSIVPSVDHNAAHLDDDAMMLTFAHTCCCPCCCAVPDVCAEAASLPAYSVQLSSSLCPSTPQGATLSLSGVPCGPANSLIQWDLLNLAACGATISRAALDPKQQADWVGQCGVPPMQISGLPTRICSPSASTAATRRRTVRRFPQPNTGDSAPAFSPEGPSIMGLGRVPLLKGESTANWGMGRIGALANGKVIDATAAFVATGIKVIVMDTGVETSHPDLNVVEFVDFYDEKGQPDHGIDGHGHGTHVGGERVCTGAGLGANRCTSSRHGCRHLVEHS